jgi:uncharacterized protein (DUF58 family)
MKIVEAPKLKKYFFKKSSLQRGFSKLFHFQTQLYEPLPMMMGLIFFLLIFWFWYPIAGAVGMSLGFFVFFEYLKLKKKCQGLEVKRQFKEQASEYESLDIYYHLINRSPFTFYRLEMVDEFAGLQKVSMKIQINSLKKLQKKIHKHSVLIDGGMGNKKFNSIEIYVSDFFGFFEFKVHWHFPDDQVLVFPKIELINHMHLESHDSASGYGLIEVNKKGESANFMGIRPYRPGDMVKFINWKLSSKHGETIVNEYEQISNSKISILCNMDQRDHLGQGAKSTWEYTKDLSLSVSSQLLSQGHEVQFLSQSELIPWGKGASFSSALALRICHWDLVPPEKHGNSDMQFLNLWKKAIPSHGTIVFISPLLISARLKIMTEELLKYCYQGHLVHFLFISPFPYAHGKIHDFFKIDLAGLHAQSEDFLQELKKRLGAKVQFLKVINISDQANFRDELALKMGAARV